MVRGNSYCKELFRHSTKNKTSGGWHTTPFFLSAPQMTSQLTIISSNHTFFGLSDASVFSIVLFYASSIFFLKATLFNMHLKCILFKKSKDIWAQFSQEIKMFVLRVCETKICMNFYMTTVTFKRFSSLNKKNRMK